ncbi:MAG: DUF882 domain-containing protein [Elusimicrobiales bacterium]|nr:DUF882 domain-containing protein [Elusimicrobiales bacterium]
MLLRVSCAAALALLLCAGQGKEVSVDEFLENLPSLLDTAPEPPEVTEAQVIELEEGDPETYVFIHGAKAHPPPPVNLGGDGVLTLRRQDSREQVTARYRGKDGGYSRPELDKLQRLLRCSATGKETEISIKLLEILDVVEDKSGSSYLVLLSGYRSPKFNRKLKGAARWSMHMLGWAADIRVPGRPTAEVADFANRLGAGGVGHYPDAGFVHLDAGRSRSWEVKRPEPKPKKEKKK